MRFRPAICWMGFAILLLVVAFLFVARSSSDSATLRALCLAKGDVPVGPEPTPVISDGVPAKGRSLEFDAPPQAQIWAQAIGIGRSDFRSAAKLIRDRFPPARQEELLSTLLGMLGAERLELLPVGLKEIRNADAYKAAGDMVIGAWRKKDPYRLAAYAQSQLIGSIKNQALKEAIQQFLVLRDLPAALNALQAIPKSQVRIDLIESYALVAAANHLPSAWDWAGTITDAEERNAAQQAVIGTSTDLLESEQILQYADSTEDASLQRSWVAAAARRVVKENPASAMAWAANLSASHRGTVERVIVQHFLQHDLDAANEVLLQMKDASRQLGAAGDIRENLLKRSPEDAVAWMNTLPEHLQNHVAPGIALKWHGSDREAAMDWVRKLPPGELRDNTAGTLIGLMARENPASAASLLPLIGSASRREAFRKVIGWK